MPLGFVATHFYQRHQINFLWTVIAIIGLSYMWRVMPRVAQSRQILMAWLVPITLGILVSGGAFYVHTNFAAHFIGHLGCFWLAVMAVGYFWNGLVDPPSKWYWINTTLNAGLAVACYEMDAFVDVQYLVAAIVSFWSMANLWLFRSE